MIRLGVIQATAGDTITLKTTTKGKVTTYFGVLKVFDGRGSANEAQWKPSELQGPGGQAVIRANVNGYDVIIVPEIGTGGSIDATLTVGAQTSKKPIKQSLSAGWSIFVV